MSTQTAHTPGPWTFTPIHGNPHSFYLLSPAGEVMSETWATTYLRRDALEANARLIAAAPELLVIAHDALRDAELDLESLGDCGTPDTEDIDSCEARISRIKAVIAKVEGKP